MLDALTLVGPDLLPSDARGFRRSMGALKPVNSSRAVAMLMRVQFSSASPGGRTASTKVLLVSLAKMRLKRGVRMKNSLNWWEELDEEVKFLQKGYIR